MLVVPPRATAGVEIVRGITTRSTSEPTEGDPGGHAEIRFRSVRVPFDHIVGGAEGIGVGFRLAQQRLGPDRTNHAMRWIGQSRRAFDMLCDRALPRFIHGSRLADKQMTQNWIAESYAEMRATRLLTLNAAWQMDHPRRWREPERSASGDRVVKLWGARVLYNVIDVGPRLTGISRIQPTRPSGGLPVRPR